MNDIKQIIVLGAGASKSDDAPLQIELLEEFFKYYRRNKENHVNSLAKGQEKLLIKFFDKFWDIDIENHRDYEFPTFEECLGVLDLAYIRREGFSGFSRDEINKTRNALIFLIGKTLDEMLRGKLANNHQNLINRMKKEGNLLKTAFISFNYDIIIDNVLAGLRNTDNLFLDYGIDFINEDWEPPIGSSIPLFKIHGSLNWLYCPTCNKMEYTYDEKKRVYNSICKVERCKQCKMALEPVIVPPTYYKDMNNLFIQEIFLNAESALREAEDIIFCGYSFPDSDIHLKYILKRAELFNKKLQNIFIINRNPKKEYSQKEKDKEKNRISRIFKSKEKLNFTDLSFQDFCENGV